MALTRRGASVVSHYQYVKSKELKILEFPDMTEEWLQFVVECRSGIEHDYDIVEGPMADDPICDVIDNYNCSAFYEPSYVIARAYQNGGF